jgi:hypothetical protein
LSVLFPPTHHGVTDLFWGGPLLVYKRRLIVHWTLTAGWYLQNRQAGHKKRDKAPKKNGLRPKKRRKQNKNIGREASAGRGTEKKHGPAGTSHGELLFTEDRSVCGELQFFVLKPQAAPGAQKPSSKKPQPPWGFALRLRRPGGSFIVIIEKPRAHSLKTFVDEAVVHYQRSPAVRP